MKLMLRYLRPFWGMVVVTLSIKTLGTFIELFLPYILSHILDDVVPLADVWKIVYWGALMIVCALVAFLLNVIANRCAAKVSRNATEKMRGDLFRKILYLSSRQTDAFTIPSLESRLTSDTYHIHRFMGMMQRMGVRAPILLLGGLVMTMLMDLKLTLVMVAVLPFISFSVWFISRKGVPLYSDVQKNVDGMTRVVREDAQGIRVIKALSRTEYEKDRFDRVNGELVRTEKRAGIIMAASNPTMNLFLNLGLTAVILVGALLIDADTGTQPGTIIAFTQYFTLLSNALLSITRIFIMYTKAAASANRVAEVLACEEELPLATEEIYPAVPEDDRAYISFDHVCFSYNKTKNNLNDISFAVPKGGTLGIIGATGSGKSTILQLLMRFYDVDAGSVRIGGRDVRTIPTGELRTKFGAALQNDFIFSGTVEENLRFGRELSEEALYRAVDISQAGEFIRGLDDGLSHPVASKGANFSGGQKQRLLIARALAGSPEILILDDASSALDYRTDAQLRGALAENPGKSTRIIVAQRVSSVMNSDCILVLDEGEVVAFGSHDQLIETCDIYREISLSQMGGAILE